MDYKQTVQLPKTGFPMKANLAGREPEQLAAWDRMELYAGALNARRGAPPFILHDGPPYANGRIHIGHALNKILKDIIVKSKLMDGAAAPYVPGWDCHGLPIEHQVMKEAGPKARTLDRLEIRHRCRAYAEKFMAIQREEFQRLGCLGEWDRPYATMQPIYEAAIVRAFGQCVAAGSVYKAKKPVLWCWHDETALAEAEVEYEAHTSPSVYVKFPLRGLDDDPLIHLFRQFNIQDIPQTHRLTGKNVSSVIWTTTPWTLVANQAICLHPDIEYVVSIIDTDAYIVAKQLIDQFRKTIGADDTVTHNVCVFRGSQIEGWEFSHPWLDRRSPIILGEHVTLDQGTGCVHTAPGHGQEDYEVGLRYGLPVYAPVDSRGAFEPDAGPFAGQQVFSANRAIIDLLRERGMLLKQSDLSHSYPHCWRCKNPVIFRATEQWFISMEHNNLRARALEAIEGQVDWIPKWGRDRIYGMIKNRPDWCISRQRAWGVPIVAFRCSSCKTIHYSQEIAAHVAGLIDQAPEGSDIWFTKHADELLLPGYACCNARRFDKEMDILDVWFESGVSHAAVLQQRDDLQWPADLYLEGSDQHRGWFHSALLTALLTDGRPPYKAVLTHGFVVDGEGKKMSKSAGNVVAPQEVIQQHGAEILRLWVAAADYREDVRISAEILAQLVEAYRKIRNTCRFLLGNLADFDPRQHQVADAQMDPIDRWTLSRLHDVTRKILAAYHDYEFHLVVHTLNHFCAAELSALYFDILKDRLYCDAADSRSRRSAQTALYQLLHALTRLMAPVLSFTADEVWQHMPDSWKADGPHSVLLSEFPATTAGDPRIESQIRPLIAIREIVSKKLEEARRGKSIGSSLDSLVELGADAATLQVLRTHEDFLPALFIVSQVVLRAVKTGEPVQTVGHDGSGEVAVTVKNAPGDKCVRCWKYDDAVGRDAQHPALCARCTRVVREL